MPDRTTVDQVAYVFRVLTQCDAKTAAGNAETICRDPEALNLLAMACGAGTAATGLGGALVWAGPDPTSKLAGVALGGAGLLAARRFCSRMIAVQAEVVPLGLKQLLK